jgi:hypothetical protein
MKYLVFLFFGIIFVSSTCVRDNENCHRTLILINDSDKAIYFHPSSSYPDTLTLDYNPSEAGNDFKIEKNSFKKDIYRSCIEGKFLIANKIRYFIYDAQTLETTPWDTVKKNYMILKRYELTLQDLENMNWTITYP